MMILQKNSSLTEKIIELLKKAGNIKDRIDIKCHRQIRYNTKLKKYLNCVKCYPEEKEECLKNMICNKKCIKCCSKDK